MSTDSSGQLANSIDEMFFFKGTREDRNMRTAITGLFLKVHVPGLSYFSMLRCLVSHWWATDLEQAYADQVLQLPLCHMLVAYYVTKENYR